MSKKALSGGAGGLFVVILGGGEVVSAFLLKNVPFSTIGIQTFGSVDDTDPFLDNSNLELISLDNSKLANLSVAKEQYSGWKSKPSRLETIWLQFHTQIRSHVTLSPSLWSPQKTLYKVSFSDISNLISRWPNMGDQISFECLPQGKDYHCWNSGKNHDYYLINTTPSIKKKVK